MTCYAGILASACALCVGLVKFMNTIMAMPVAPESRE